MFTGINNDLHPRYNSEEYNFALNANLESGALPFLHSDFSNELCVDLKAEPVGHCIDNDGNFIVLLDNNSIVRFFPGTCTVTTLYSNPDLNFGNWVEVLYTRIRGCEEVIYLADASNKYRVINLSQVKPTTSVEEFNFNINTIPFNIQPRILQGGSLNSGSYWYTVRIVDSSGNPSNWSPFYEPIYIHDTTAIYNSLTNIDKLKTNLSIEFDIETIKLKTGYSYQIGVVEYSNLNKAISNVYLLGENVNYFTGTNYSSLTSLQALVVDNLTVDKVYTHTKHLNKLFIGNVKGIEYDYATVQKLANRINVQYVVKAVPKLPFKEESVRTYRHNDVYDIGVVGIFTSGTSTPVFHIPGREKLPGTIPAKYDNKPHVTSGFKVNIDSVLVNNKTNAGADTVRELCTDCAPIEISYKSSFTINNGKIKFNVKFDANSITLPRFLINVVYGLDKKSSQNLTPAQGIDGVDFEFTDGGIDNCFIEIYVTSQANVTCSYRIDNDGYKTSDAQSIFNSVVSPLQVEAWNIFNTALKHKLPIHGYHSSGLMAYYEACESYPDDTDCNGVPIYPHKMLSNGLYKMDRVRYHRMPDQVLEPIQGEDSVYRLEPLVDINKFTQEITSAYPDLAKQIIQWKVVIGERNNPIVKDSGLLMNTFSIDGAEEDSTPILKLGVEEKDLLVAPPVYQVKGQGNGLLGENLYGMSTVGSFSFKAFYSPKVLIENTIDFGMIYVNSQYQNEVTNPSVYKRILKSKDKDASTNFTFRNNNIRHDSNWVYDLITVKGGKNNIFGTFSTNGPVYKLLKSKRVISPVKHIQEADGSEYVGVPDFINGTTVRNMLYSNNAGIYEINSVSNEHLGRDFNYYVDIINYTQPYTFNNTVYHEMNLGDSWITPFTFTLKVVTFIPDKSSFGKIFSSGFGNAAQWVADGLGANIEREVYTKLLVRSYIESDINADYRFSGQEAWEKVLYGKDSGFSKFLNSDRKNISDTTKTEEDIVWEYFRDYQKYSKDYSVSTSPRPYFKLPNNYDYCSNCNHEYPNRIYYSESSYLENNIDNFRVIKVNNYQDLGTPINTLFLSKDELFARTTKHLYQVPTRPSELKADNTNVYIGTNTFLSIPAKRISSVDYTYGGSNQKLDILQTEMSTIFPSNSILEIGEGFSVLEKGLRNFLKNNLLPFNEVNNNPNYSKFNSFYSSNRLYNLTYDYLHNRVFISKKEYLTNPEFGGSIKMVNGKPYLDKNKALIPVSFDDTDIFVNSSFNLSYNLATKSFISFHSWIPDYTMFDSRAYYSVKDNILYKHLDTNTNKGRLRYYGKYYDFVVEKAIVSKEGVSTFDNIIYRQNLNHSEYLPYKTILGNTKEVLNTFTSYVAYNDLQSTGEIPLVMKASIFDTSNLSYRESRFTFFLERELSLNKKFLDWSIIEDRQVISLTGRFIDKIFNQNIFDTADDFFINKARLRDDYVNIRLIYNPAKATAVNNIEDIDSVTHSISIDLIDAKTEVSKI